MQYPEGHLDERLLSLTFATVVEIIMFLTAKIQKDHNTGAFPIESGQTAKSA
jgi:hypothetical protein